MPLLPHMNIFSWTSKFIIILIEMTRMMMNNPNLMYESEHASPWINTSIKCKLVRATYHWISDIPGHPTDNNCTAWLLTCPSPPRDSISYQVACKTDAKPQSAWISTCFASMNQVLGDALSTVPKQNNPIHYRTLWIHICDDLYNSIMKPRSTTCCKP